MASIASRDGSQAANILGMDFLRFKQRIMMTNNRGARYSPEAMQIFVRTPTNRTTTLMVESSDKIATIKVKIEDKMGYPRSQQCLTYSGKRLGDDHTLASYHIYKGSTLFLELLPSATFCLITVQILPRCNRVISLIVPQGWKATIRQVKNIIREEEGIVCEDLCLEHDINEYVKVGDNVTLEACNVPEKTLVWLQSSRSSLLTKSTICNIKILPSNLTISLKVPQGLKATVREVKNLIREKERILCEDLWFNEHQALGDDVTLEAACNVPEKALVCLFSSKSSVLSSAIHCNVKVLPSNRIISLEVKKGLKATIREVKDLIKKKEGIECEDLSLEHHVNQYAELEDNVTLEACNVPEKSLVWRQPARSWGPSSEHCSNPLEYKSNGSLVFDADHGLAKIGKSNMHRDDEGHLSLLDHKNKQQRDLVDLHSEFPHKNSLMRDEKKKLHEDLAQLHGEFPQQLSLVLDENEKLQRDLNELHREFHGQLSLILDENSKIRSESVVLQNELHSVRSELGQERERQLCTICLDRPRDTLVFSCLHLHFCSQCLEQHQKQRTTCPTCRGFITGKLVCNVSVS